MPRSQPATWPTIIALLCIAQPALAADSYKTDPDHTSVIFSAGSGRLSICYGMFRKAGGTYQIDKTNPAKCQFKFKIGVDSLDTNLTKRDDILRGPNFFDVQKFPDIRFDSTLCDKIISQDGGTVYKVAGNLMIHGVTRPVTLLLRQLGEGPGAEGNDHRTGFSCQTELKRSDFGMDFLLKNDVVGNTIGITISFEGIRQDQPAAPVLTTPPRP